MNLRLPALLAIAISALFATFTAGEDPKPAPAGTPVLVELFSSQG